jgi:hypothetical protein
MLLEYVQSSSDYLVISEGVVLSEHSSVADARRGRTNAKSEGFAEAVIFKRTPNGWQPCGKLKLSPESE